MNEALPIERSSAVRVLDRVAAVVEAFHRYTEPLRYLDDVRRKARRG